MLYLCKDSEKVECNEKNELAYFSHCRDTYLSYPKIKKVASVGQSKLVCNCYAKLHPILSKGYYNCLEKGSTSHT